MFRTNINGQPLEVLPLSLISNRLAGALNLTQRSRLKDSPMLPSDFLSR